MTRSSAVLALLFALLAGCTSVDRTVTSSVSAGNGATGYDSCNSQNSWAQRSLGWCAGYHENPRR